MENKNLGEYIQKKLISSLKNNEEDALHGNVEAKDEMLTRIFKSAFSEVKKIIVKYTDGKVPMNEVDNLLWRLEDDFDETRKESKKQIENVTSKMNEEYDIESLLTELTADLPTEVESIINEKDKQKINYTSLNNVKPELDKERQNAYQISQKNIEEKVESEIMEELKPQISRYLESRSEWPVDMDEMRYDINNSLKLGLLESIKSELTEIDKATLEEITTTEDLLVASIHFEFAGELERIIDEKILEVEKEQKQQNEQKVKEDGEISSSFEEKLRGDVNSLEEVAKNSANVVYEDEEPEKDSKEQDLPGDVLV